MKSPISNGFTKAAIYTLSLAAFALGVASIVGFSYTVVMAKRVSVSIVHADTYNRAKEAVLEEESLERKYRLEPGHKILARYEAASSKLVPMLGEIARANEPSDKKLYDEVMLDHATYLQASHRMFDAVDAANWKLVQKIDTYEVDPIFDKIVTRVNSAAENDRHFALSSVASFLELQSLVFFGLVAIVIVIFFLLGGVGWMYVREQHFVNTANENLYRSQHDVLTGLPNRQLFTQHAEDLLIGRTNIQRIAVMLLDLDRFKEINDTFGHHIGDELLQQVAVRLSATLNSTQMLARLSGDEFTVIFPDISDRAEAVQVAKNMVDSIKESFTLHGISASIGVSIGISYAPEHGTIISELLKAADAAMYIAKREHTGYAVYTP